MVPPGAPVTPFGPCGPLGQRLGVREQSAIIDFFHYINLIGVR